MKPIYTKELLEAMEAHSKKIDDAIFGFEPPLEERCLEIKNKTGMLGIPYDIAILLDFTFNITSVLNSIYKEWCLDASLLNKIRFETGSWFLITGNTKNIIQEEDVLNFILYNKIL